VLLTSGACDADKVIVMSIAKLIAASIANAIATAEAQPLWCCCASPRHVGWEKVARSISIPPTAIAALA